MPFLLLALACLALLGLFLSLAAHLAALVGMPQPLGSAAWGLHIGIFVVWIPAIIAANHLVKDFRRKDFWKAALRGCPTWMRWLTYGFFGYAFINFIVFILSAPPNGVSAGAGTPAVVFRGFSGHWMAFYSAAGAILYSSFVVGRRDPSRRCPNNHPVSPSALYCEVCGAYVGEPDYAGSPKSQV